MRLLAPHTPPDGDSFSPSCLLPQVCRACEPFPKPRDTHALSPAALRVDATRGRAGPHAHAPPSRPSTPSPSKTTHQIGAAAGQSFERSRGTVDFPRSPKAFEVKFTADLLYC